MKFTALILSFILFIGVLTGCKSNENSNTFSSDPQSIVPTSNKTVNLMKTITAKTVHAAKPSAEQIGGMADIYLSLFKKAQENGENSLISPLSVGLALSMTANGSVDTVQQEFLSLLGADSLQDLNNFYKAYTSALNENIAIANSIWIRNGFPVKPSFLQTNADYYKAGVFQAPFNEETVKDMNDWVSERTDGMIKKLVDNLDPDACMSLINTVLLKSAWQEPFYAVNTKNDNFKDSSGKTVSTPFLNGGADSYFNINGGIDIVKSLAYGCNFVAVLPPENTDIAAFTEQLSGGALINAMKDRKNDRQILLSLPKFKYEYSKEMSDLLKSMGLKKAFEFSRDFSGIAERDLAIYRVMHKTAVELDEKGIAAAAATEVGMMEAIGGLKPEEPLNIKFDRPFIFFITDSSYHMPIFIGTVNTL